MVPAQSSVDGALRSLEIDVVALDELDSRFEASIAVEEARVDGEQLRTVEIAGEDVEGHLQARGAREARAQLFVGAVRDQARELLRAARALDNLDEATWSDDGAVNVPPACEHLAAWDLARAQVEDRLIDDKD